VSEAAPERRQQIEREGRHRRPRFLEEGGIDLAPTARR
jgi:hypothetical protein